MLEIITRYNMFERGARVGVAVSGGADSVCLLYAMCELAPRWDLGLSVLHLNHGLRGAESDWDEEFVRELAAGLNLSIIAERWKREPEEGANLEEAARQARLAFFARVIESGTVDRVALGHTRSDQAETVLFRLLRGSGAAGLSGIRPVASTGLVRPLLLVDRAEVEAYLVERGAGWREDSTNLTLHFARNRIRHELLPLLARDWNPSITGTLATMAEWAQAEEAYWEAEIDRLAASAFRECARAIIVNTQDFNQLPLAAARRLVRRAMERVKGDLRAIDFGHVSAVLAMMSASEGHGRLQVPGLDIIRSFDWVRFALQGADSLEARNFNVAAAPPGRFHLPGSDAEICLELIENPKDSTCIPGVYNGNVAYVDWIRVSRVSSGLELRNWRPGDQYCPAGSTEEAKIKTMFQKARVPLWERRRWPVLTAGAEIVWARRFGPAAGFAADSGTRVGLQVRDSGGITPVICR